MRGVRNWVIVLGLLVGSSAWANEDIEQSQDPDGRGWNRDIEVDPDILFGRFGTDDDVYRHMVLGGGVSLNYRQRGMGPKLKGATRAQVHWQLGSGVRGRELRVGSFMGPSIGPISISAGPDVFMSRADYGNSVVLAPTMGVSLPVILTGDLGLARAYTGVIPSWYLGGERAGMDGDNLLGMGDESAFVAGFYLTVVLAHLGIDYRLNQTAYGDHHQFGLSVGLGM